MACNILLPRSAFMRATLTDRRGMPRDPLYTTRRRYPRLQVRCDAFYEGEATSVATEELDLSLRGLFVPCRIQDAIGARGVVRLDLGDGPLVRLEAEVTRQVQGARPGMAMRIVAMSDADRLRLGAFLVRHGGLAAIPQLDRAYRTLTRAPRPLGTLSTV
jgi:hypothetical protein